MSKFYLIDQNTQSPGGPIIETYPDTIDVLEVISGKRLPWDPDTTITLKLSKSSGDFRPDLVTYLLPLFSDKIKECLTKLNVDNIDYYPVFLDNPNTGKLEPGYWLANIIGVIKCVDISQSDAKQHPLSKRYTFKSFVVDEALTNSQSLFRLAEMRRLIVINETLKKCLEECELTGIRITNTRDYEGD